MQVDLLAFDGLPELLGEHVVASAPACHWQARDIYRPDLIRPIDGPVAQQIRIEPMFGTPATSVGFAVHGLDAHGAYQRRHMNRTVRPTAPACVRFTAASATFA